MWLRYAYNVNNKREGAKKEKSIMINTHTYTTARLAVFFKVCQAKKSTFNCESMTISLSLVSKSALFLSVPLCGQGDIVPVKTQS